MSSGLPNIWSLDWTCVEAYCLVADAGSFRKASGDNNWSTETLRRRVVKLEEALGKKLFRRTQSGIVLTSFGNAILEHARRAKFSIDQIKLDVGSAELVRPRKFNIATTQSLSMFLTNSVVRDIYGCNYFTDIEFNIIDSVNDASLMDVDIAVLNELPNIPEMRCLRLGCEKWSIVSREDRKNFKMSEKYGNEKVLFYVSGEKNVIEYYFNTVEMLRDRNFCVLASSDVSAVFSALSQLNVAGIVPLSQAEKFGFFDIVHFLGGKHFSRDVWLSYHEDVVSTVYGKKLLQTIKNQFGETLYNHSSDVSGVKAL